MGRARICPLCNKTVSKEESFEYKSRYYHESCFVKFSKQTTKDKVKEKKEKQKIDKVKKSIQQDTLISIEIDLSDEEVLAKEKVVNYLKELLNNNQLNVKIYKLLKDYYTVYKFSYEGMLIALKYFYEIKENPIVPDCVGIIPYIYEEAQEYEKIKASVVKQVEKLDLKNMVISKIVKIKKQNRKIHNLIDIEDLR